MTPEEYRDARITSFGLLAEGLLDVQRPSGRPDRAIELVASERDSTRRLIELVSTSSSPSYAVKDLPDGIRLAWLRADNIARLWLAQFDPKTG